MKLHKRGWQRNLGRMMAPVMSNFICVTGTTDYVRKIIAFLNYSIGRGSGMGWAIESEVKAALVHILRENPVVIDVGANIGAWSGLFRKFNQHGMLYLFEPQKSCQEKILELNLPNSKLIACAVGSEASKLNLYTSSATDGSASLNERRDSYFEDNVYSKIEVDVVRLDDFLKNEEIDFVDYIKFDIEGHEYNALLGLEDTLRNKKVGALSFEFGSGNLNSKTCFRDFWDLLSEDYDLHIITPSGKLQQISQYYEDLEYFRGVSNYIACLKNVHIDNRA